MSTDYQGIYDKVSDQNPIEKLTIGRMNVNKIEYYKALVMYDKDESVKAIALTRLPDDEQQFFYDVVIDLSYPDDLRIIAFNRLADEMLIEEARSVLVREEKKVIISSE